MIEKRPLLGRPARLLGIALAASLVGCADGIPTEPDRLWLDSVSAAGRSGFGKVRFTGGVELVWPGGKGMEAPEASGRVAEASIVAFPGVPAGEPGPGTFTYRVVNRDGTLHREIGVTLMWAGLEPQTTNPGEIRFIGVVTSDTKPCGSGGEGGGCEDCSGEEDEACGGGCSGEEGGGCSGEEEGGCSDGGDACEGGVGSGGHGEPGGGGVNGSDCRIGQVVLGWARDGGTPAVPGDRISWKWFAADAPKVQAILAAIESGEQIPWPCRLCEKEILGGNLKIFLPES